MRLAQSPSNKQALRGDTVIEVMFALAFFALLAVLTIAMMNAGVANAERSLELVTARAEINAQAEALRFIHSSYASEKTLPLCSAVSSGERCQQFKSLWDNITSHALTPGGYDPGDFDFCHERYEGSHTLSSYSAFILNARQINYMNDSLGTDFATGSTANTIYHLSSDSGSAGIFVPAQLGARLIYTADGVSDYDDRYEVLLPGSGAGNESSGDDLDEAHLAVDSTFYRNLVRAEGIWVVAVKGDTSLKPAFYDFYIQACWYGSNTQTPTKLDSVIRLYNPDGV